MSTPAWRPLIAAGVTLVLWASAFVGIRHLGATVPPGALSLARLAVMTLSLLVMLRLRVSRLPTRAEWPLIALGGASWFGLYNLTLNAAEQRIDAGTASLIIQVGPILVGLLAVAVLGERLTRPMLAGMAVGFGGVALIALSSAAGVGGDLGGVLLALVAAVTFAIGVLTQRILLRTVSALELTFWYTVVGLVVCLPWTRQTVRVLGDATPDTWWWIVYLGVFPSAIAFTTWAYALSHAHDAGSFAQSTFMVPFFTVLLAWALLDEIPPALAFVGGALCVAGVVISSRRRRV